MYRLLFLGLCLSGCTTQTVRNTSSLVGEINWFATAASQLTDKGKDLIKVHCPCGTAEPKCIELAKTIGITKVRVPWHKDAALYNSGVLKGRPVKEPPMVLSSETILCKEIP